MGARSIAQSVTTEPPRTTDTYRVAVTGDQANPDGSTIFGDIGLARLETAGFEWRVIPVDGDVLSPTQIHGFDALLMMGGKGIDSSSFDETNRLRHIARFGAGYDAIDVAACTRSGVVVTNTPDAVRAPMAQAALTMVLALAHNLLAKDHLVRSNRWLERIEWQGRGIGSRTVGIVGFGSIGSETARLFRALGVRVIAYNRSDKTELAKSMGVQLMPLAEVVARSDFIVVTVAGGAQTTGLISSGLIGSMKPDAFLVNVARGSVVDEKALVEALRAGRIAGAGLDVFQHEPIDLDSPLIAMQNVILTPHSLSWTDEFAEAVADSAITALLDVGQGRTPRNVVNPEVLS
ncbi:MAG: hypothetical protein JWO18_30 [Microbacteriaceae bacterium]|jgi:phosphoglycerate dehydrogenase-like enzyme|nr:hypothetical protein [Microbacteriaceae bacterium]